MLCETCSFFSQSKLNLQTILVISVTQCMCIMSGHPNGSINPSNCCSQKRFTGEEYWRFQCYLWILCSGNKNQKLNSFCTFTRKVNLNHVLWIHKFRNLLPNPSAVTIIIVQSKLYVRRIIMSHILKTFYFYFIVMLTVTNFSCPILLPGQMLVWRRHVT